MAFMRHGERHAPPGNHWSGVPLIQSAERLASILGGGTLAYFGWQRRDEPVGITLLALGGVLMAHGASGYPEVRPERLAPERLRRIASERVRAGPVTVSDSITIMKPREELYRFWRDVANLARFMGHVERIDVLSDKRSHWVVRAPMGRTVEWDALIDDERDNERLGWHSVEGADVPNSGAVTFRDAPDGRGTEVHVTLTYEPPGGQLGRAVAWLFGEEPSVQLRDNLRRLKQVMETGEVVRSEGSLRTGHPARPPASPT